MAPIEEATYFTWRRKLSRLPKRSVFTYKWEEGKYSTYVSVHIPNIHHQHKLSSLDAYTEIREPHPGKLSLSHFRLLWYFLFHSFSLFYFPSHFRVLCILYFLHFPLFLSSSFSISSTVPQNLGHEGDFGCWLGNNKLFSKLSLLTKYMLCIIHITFSWNFRPMIP